jgi:hypothetical protein
MKQGTQDTNDQNNHQVPWNKGKLIGQKSPLKLKEIWAIRIRLQMAKNTRELALFNCKRPALPILLNQSHLSFSIIAGVKGSNSSIRLFGQVGNFSRVSFNHSSGFKPFSLAVPSKV